MVLWEWEGMGTEIVLPAHLYFPLDVLTKCIASDTDVSYLYFFAITHEQINLIRESVIVSSFTFQFLYISILNHQHFHIDRQKFIKNLKKNVYECLLQLCVMLS